MKKQLVIFGIIITTLIVGLSGCIGPTTGYMITKLDREPDNFVDMTEKQMEKFPLLKEAILTNKTVEVSSPSHEITQLGGIFEYFDTNVICYQNEFYEVMIFCAD